MAKVEIYNIGLDALHQLFPNEGEVEGARVGDYYLVCWGGNKEMLFPAPAILKCHDRETAVEFAVRNAAGDFEDICNGFMGWALDYEVWHVVDHVIAPVDGADSPVGFFAVSLSDLPCRNPREVLSNEVAIGRFRTYSDAEGFAVRNVCESVPSVLIGFYSDNAFEPVRFLRWSGESVGLDYRSATFPFFGEGQRPNDFSIPTRNGRILSFFRGGAR